MDYDVIVAGAGPAGSTTAKLLADAGARVALVDAARFPRDKTCAGWLNARAVARFAFLDAARRKVGAAPFKRLVFHSPDLSATARYATRSHLGYIVRRRAFDAELLRLARRAGADAVLGRKIVDVHAGEHEVAVRLSSRRRLTGRLLVGADGAASPVARMTGLRQRWDDRQLVWCLARQVALTKKQVTDGFSGGGEIHVALGFGGAPGYAWAFPGSDFAGIGVGIRGGDGARLKSLYAAWAAHLKEKGFLPPRGGTARPDAAPVPAGAAIEFENHVGKRTLLVGDAGGFASAASGEGIYPAVRSAAVAAECLQKALAADRGQTPGATCQDELMRFKTEWRRELAAYLQMPNVNMTFLLPLIFTNQEIADRFARAFLFGENL